jgi:hypothetical protein
MKSCIIWYSALLFEAQVTAVTTLTQPETIIKIMCARTTRLVILLTLDLQKLYCEWPRSWGTRQGFA